MGKKWKKIELKETETCDIFIRVKLVLNTAFQYKQ
jgi:hypothetical protein